MTLVWLVKDATYQQLAADFRVAVGTAHEYVNDTIDQLAVLAPTLSEAIAAVGADRRLLLDGTLIPTWRCAASATETNADPLYDGKHHDHGVVIKSLTNPDGELAFLGQARLGSAHDLTAARDEGIIDALTQAGVETLADCGYQGAGGTVRTPVKRPKGLRHNGLEKHANALHARLRAAVERGFAVLKRSTSSTDCASAPATRPHSCAQSPPSSRSDLHPPRHRPKMLTDAVGALIDLGDNQNLAEANAAASRV